MAKKASLKEKIKTVVGVIEKPNEPKENFYVIIDYPQEGEVINSSHYAIKIGASPDGYVEISIDNGDWQAARFAYGYWWYDWSPCSGSHKISARLKKDDKVLKKSNIRKCNKG